MSTPNPKGSVVTMSRRQDPAEDDGVIIARIAGGNLAALGVLHDRHSEAVRRFVLRATSRGADADDIVQESFVRALQRPPADRDRPWRPWLVRVAVNLGRDLLRRRRRRGGYEGQWLPSPIETEPPSHEPADERGSPAARYDLLESVSFAFLLALEALTPMQRATLLLRDVFDYSGREAARALGISEASARVGRRTARIVAPDARRQPQDARLLASQRDARRSEQDHVARPRLRHHPAGGAEG